MGLKNRIVDALLMVDSDNLFTHIPSFIHCNVDGTYYLHSGVEWVIYEMVGGIDYYSTCAKGIKEVAAAVDSGDITLVY